MTSLSVIRLSTLPIPTPDLTLHIEIPFPLNNLTLSLFVYLICRGKWLNLRTKFVDMENDGWRCGGRGSVIAVITLILFVAMLFVAGLPAKGRVKLPGVIGPGMVVQREAPIRLWGKADVGERVVARIGKSVDSILSEMQTVANNDGKWMLELPAVEAGGSYVITINDTTVDNVLSGDVYLCSGQSNMELPLRRVMDKFSDEITSYSNDLIREFRVPSEYDFHSPRDEFNGGTWRSTTAENVMNFSALGHFFAKELYSRTGIPVGIINSSWGGTPIEAWISEGSLNKVSPRSIGEKRIYEDDAYRERIKRLEGENFKRWEDALFSGDPGMNDRVRWYESRFDDSGWEPMDLSKDTGWSTDGINPINGSHWFRKHLTLTATQAKNPAVLRLGCIVDADSVYVNGKFVGTTSYQYPPRIYNVPAEILRKGENTITVRLISQNGPGGFVAEKPYKLITSDGEIGLDGEWLYHIGMPMPHGPGMEFFHYKPTVLYNSMIHPLANLNIAGIVWYQGESNVERRNEYGDLLTTMIADWRKLFREPEIPFYIIELADFLHPSDTIGRKAWAEMRAIQSDVAQKTPRTTLIKNYDLGEWNDIHPLDKKTLGKRLADAVTGHRYDGSRLWLPEKSHVVRDDVECVSESPASAIAVRT